MSEKVSAPSRRRFHFNKTLLQDNSRVIKWYTRNEVFWYTSLEMAFSPTCQTPVNSFLRYVSSYWRVVRPNKQNKHDLDVRPRPQWSKAQRKSISDALRPVEMALFAVVDPSKSHFWPHVHLWWRRRWVDVWACGPVSQPKAPSPPQTPQGGGRGWLDHKGQEEHGNHSRRVFLPVR